MGSFTHDPAASGSDSYIAPLGELFEARYEAKSWDYPDKTTFQVRQKVTASVDLVTRDFDLFTFQNNWIGNVGVGQNSNIWANPTITFLNPCEWKQGEALRDGYYASQTFYKDHVPQRKQVTLKQSIEGRAAAMPDDGSPDLDDSSACVRESDETWLSLSIPAKDSYAVTFDANGGDQAQCPEPLTKWYDEELAIPECVMASQLGVFSGWSLSPNGQAAFPEGVIPSNVNEPIKFYAVWDSGIYDLTLSPNGGVGDAIAAERETGVAYVLEGCTFTREGYDFQGWALTPEGSAEYADEETFVLASGNYRPSVTLYAVWKREGPSITSMVADRNGESSGYALVSFSLYQAADGSAQTADVTLTATPRDATGELPPVIAPFEGLAPGEPHRLDVTGLSDKCAYEIEVEVTDGLDASLTAEAYSLIGTGSYTLDFAPGGKGIGVFRKCPDGQDGLFVDGAFTYNDVLLEDLFKAAILASHPIGSYYWSDEPDDPGTIFGGTWKAVTDRFVYAAGEKGVGDTGGAKEVRLTAAQSGSPAHRHPVDALNTGGASADHTHSMQGHTHTSANKLLGTTGTFYRMSGCVKTATATGYSAAHSFVYNDTDGSTGTKVTGGPSVASTGGQSQTHAHQVPAHETGYSSGEDASQAHDNMPPYIVAYCWRRVA